MTLTSERLKEALIYEPMTGIFTWRIGFRHAGKEAGSIKQNGYREIGIDGLVYGAHRLAWLYMTGSFPEGFIDHINRNPLDNRFSNLRPATYSENAENRSCRGVTFNKQCGKWQASIHVDGKGKYLGLFPDEQSARNAYLAAKAIFHPFFYGG